MKAFYIQQADTITPIFGAATLSEAQEWAGSKAAWVVETEEAVYINPKTGSVGFESDWDDHGVRARELIPVRYCADSEGWVEA